MGHAKAQSSQSLMLVFVVVLYAVAWNWFILLQMIWSMTRINAGIPPRVLSDQHLLAEHREIKRLPAVFANNTHPTEIPDEFSLGKGHVKFFLDKGKFTLTRYKQIYKECVDRGFEVTDYSKNWDIYKDHPVFNRDYKPTPEAIDSLRERIIERISNSKQTLRYYKRKISGDELICIISLWIIFL